ncbi:hypothetical protein RF11_01816 [Thelohanellus kitauei]|uniref:Uncharacterized protein n=1 Tax=Thelohanellus kitauei TaxID=669202 RepID=A0A0C2NJH0_THEKT|nr:hypothetical protein RF11_01816 [Thelohanellus kitauei]
MASLLSARPKDAPWPIPLQPLVSKPPSSSEANQFQNVELREKIISVTRSIIEYFSKKNPSRREYSEFQGLKLDSSTSIHDFRKESLELLNWSRLSLSKEYCEFLISQRIV